MSQANFDFEDPANFESGNADALNHCPHQGTVNEPPADLQLDFNSTSCSVAGCSNSLELWVCLICYQLYCGRFANRHAIKHSSTQFHTLVAGISDLSFYCYECDSYVNHRTNENIKSVYSKLHQLKFGTKPPYEQQEEEETAKTAEKKKNDSEVKENKE